MVTIFSIAILSDLFVLCTPVHTAEKSGTETLYPIYDNPLSRSARRSAASLLYRNRSEVTVLVCEHKPYAFDDPLRAFLPHIPSLHITCVASVSGTKAGASD